MGLGPRILIEVVTLDIDLPDSFTCRIADDKAVIDMKLFDRAEVLDGFNFVLLDGKHLEQKPSGLHSIWRVWVIVEFAQYLTFFIPLLLFARGGVGRDQRGVNLPVVWIEIA